MLFKYRKPENHSPKRSVLQQNWDDGSKPIIRGSRNLSWHQALSIVALQRTTLVRLVSVRVAWSASKSEMNTVGCRLQTRRGDQGAQEPSGVRPRSPIVCWDCVVLGMRGNLTRRELHFAWPLNIISGPIPKK